MASLPQGVLSHNNIEVWRHENIECFGPPICNKLMHKNELSIMFVGGPNTRTDFHIDESSEFFFQMRGTMQLPTVQRGQHKLVTIRQGQVFLLPSRIPHSPQRPEADSFGLVIERVRDASELDALRWYVDAETCTDILWEKEFYCGDLGRDLVPVVHEYLRSDEFHTKVPGNHVIPDSERSLKQDFETLVPDPLDFDRFLDEHSAEIQAGTPVSVFGSAHPDREFQIFVFGGKTELSNQVQPRETWIFLYRGTARVVTDGDMEIQEGSCLVVAGGTMFSILPRDGTIGMFVSYDPVGNKQKL